MVCVAAFIILCLISVFVLILSVFRRDIGAKYWKVFKKAWGCVWKKVRLQKCETDFKDDVKNSILKHVVLKRPKLVKPISAAIEVSAVLIVLVSAWSLVEAVKAGLSLAVLGTCNISVPASCSLGADACTLEDAAQPKNLAEATGRWLQDWGEIFGGIPDRMKNWKAEDYILQNTLVVTEAFSNAPKALDIMDPLCAVCMQSYKNQKEKGFFKKNNVFIMPYAIMKNEHEPKYKNADLIVRYMHATVLHYQKTATLAPRNGALRIMERIFTEYDENHVNYQNVFSQQLEAVEAEALIKKWLVEFGHTEKEVEKIAEITKSKEVDELIQKTEEIVRKKINVRGIPTTIYNGKKHFGLYK